MRCLFSHPHPPCFPVLLGYQKKFSAETVGGWSSGTGMAGVGGAALYLAFVAAGLSNMTIFLVSGSPPPLYSSSFNKHLKLAYTWRLWSDGTPNATRIGRWTLHSRHVFLREQLITIQPLGRSTCPFPPPLSPCHSISSSPPPSNITTQGSGVAFSQD